VSRVSSSIRALSLCLSSSKGTDIALTVDSLSMVAFRNSSRFRNKISLVVDLRYSRPPFDIAVKSSFCETGIIPNLSVCVLKWAFFCPFIKLGSYVDLETCSSRKAWLDIATWFYSKAKMSFLIVSLRKSTSRSLFSSLSLILVSTANNLAWFSSCGFNSI
jgi:hypothetical protein